MEMSEAGDAAAAALCPLKERSDIDMSLDDIIQLQKKENDSLTTLDRIGQQKKIIKLYAFGQQQRVGRFSSRFYREEYSGTRWKNVRRAGTGLSPLNRQAFNPKVHRNEMQLVKRINSWQVKIHRRQMQQKRTFRSEGISAGLPKRIVPQIRRPTPQSMQRQQRQTQFNLNSGFMQRTTLNRVNLPKTRRWQPIAVSGCILTVSVANPRACQMGKANLPGVKLQTARIKAPLLRRKSIKQITKPQSKGISLSFNFKAMANQTNFTLNERFSTLKARRRFTATTSRRRTVTLI